MDGVCDGDQSTNANLGAIEGADEGSNAVKDLVQAGKAQTNMCAHNNH